ncbi:MAG: hypothetical protein KDA25_04790 [Phycisphaerales bacterium]|nr:hypothetical protein [Phycisphaerales bacterium]
MRRMIALGILAFMVVLGSAWVDATYRQVRARQVLSARVSLRGLVGVSDVSTPSDIDWRVSEYGWPLRVLRLESDVMLPLPGASPSPALRLPWWGGITLPIVPNPFRLIVSVAVLWLVLWWMSTLAMRAIRRWRGQCVRCTYPVGESEICTECGHRHDFAAPETRSADLPA